MFWGIAAAAQLSLAAAMAAPLPAADAGYADQLIALARSGHLADTREWRVLLHYRASLFGGWKSEVDGGDFFQSVARGRRDPEAELEASLRAFLAPEPRGDAHAQCRLPARWEWLRSALGIDGSRVPHESCPAFDTWRAGISATNATLVYATAYLNSPATMYGHTFLRLSRSTE